MNKPKWVKKWKALLFCCLLMRHHMVYDPGGPRYKCSRVGCHYADFGKDDPSSPLFEEK